MRRRTWVVMAAMTLSCAGASDKTGDEEAMLGSANPADVHDDGAATVSDGASMQHSGTDGSSTSDDDSATSGTPDEAVPSTADGNAAASPEDEAAVDADEGAVQPPNDPVESENAPGDTPPRAESSDDAADEDVMPVVTPAPTEDVSEDAPVAVDAGSLDGQQPPEGPTFDEVYSLVLDPGGCVAGYCHGGGAGGLDGSDVQTTYDALVGVVAGEPVCGLTERVVPFDPEASILWARVRPLEPGETEPCAAKMPKNSDGLSPELAQLVYDWIAAGAPR